MAKHDTDIDSVLPTCLLPIKSGFSLLQRSVVECMYAGCNTIWVVCDERSGPLIKRVLGDFVTDILSIDNSKFKKYPSEHIIETPIFYVPISYRNSEKKGPGVATIEGIVSSFTISSRISSWLTPSSYYISSPYSVYDPRLGKKIKSLHVDKDHSCVLVGDGHSVFTGDQLGFVIGYEAFKHCNYLYKRISTKEIYSLDKIFNNDIIKKNYDSYELDQHYLIDSWQGYENMIAGDLGFEVYDSWKKIFNSNF